MVAIKQGFTKCSECLGTGDSLTGDHSPFNSMVCWKCDGDGQVRPVACETCQDNGVILTPSSREFGFDHSNCPDCK